MLFGTVVILTKEFVSSENFGIMPDIQVLSLERTLVVDMLSVPFLAKFAIISVKISITRSSASSSFRLSVTFSPVIVFRLKMNPRSSP